MRLQRHQTRRTGASKGAISTREADQALYEQENDQDRDEERPDARQGRHGRGLSGGEVLARSSLVVHGSRGSKRGSGDAPVSGGEGRKLYVVPKRGSVES